MRYLNPPRLEVGSSVVTLTNGFTKALAAKTLDSINTHKRQPERKASMFADAVESIDLIEQAVKTLSSEYEAFAAASRAAQGQDFIDNGHPLVEAAHELYIGAKSIAGFNIQHKLATNDDVVDHLERTRAAISDELDTARKRLAKAKREAGELMVRCVASGADQKGMYLHLNLLPEGFSQLRKYLDTDLHDYSCIPSGSDYPMSSKEAALNFAMHTANRLLNARKTQKQVERSHQNEQYQQQRNDELRDVIRSLANG